MAAIILQLSDGQCICRSGYEYYNEGGVLVSTVDGAIDCQPIVYERCYTGEALDADGICVSERWDHESTETDQCDAYTYPLHNFTTTRVPNSSSSKLVLGVYRIHMSNQAE